VTDLAALKAALPEIIGIESLTETIIGGRKVYGFNGLIAAVDMNADEAAIVSAIRSAAALRLAPTSNPPKGNTMSTPAPGSFAAQIRAMMDEARAGVAQARADGIAKVGEAVGKLHDAKVATAKVADQMVNRIEDEAASVMSEIGQISNDLG
jgi:ribosomal protein L1